MTESSSRTQAVAMPSGQQPNRVVVLMDQPIIAEVITLTLNHGLYLTRGAKNAAEAIALGKEWRPHLAVIDMDLAGERFLAQVSANEEAAATRLPVLALTRRGDLKTKLSAFVAVSTVFPRSLLCRKSLPPPGVRDELSGSAHR